MVFDKKIKIWLKQNKKIAATIVKKKMTNLKYYITVAISYPNNADMNAHNNMIIICF